MLYLNEPEKGGETAFPLADNETFSTEVWLTINDYKNIRETQSTEQLTVFMTPRGLAEPEVEMSWSASLSSNMAHALTLAGLTLHIMDVTILWRSFCSNKQLVIM